MLSCIYQLETIFLVCRVPDDDKSLSQKSKKKKKARKGNNPENDSNVNEPVSLPEEHKHGQHKTRTFSNGLTIEELSMGQPDGKKASPGSKVLLSSTIYLGMHGYIYASWFYALKLLYICLIDYMLCLLGEKERERK